jgi:hypothetical protein
MALPREAHEVRKINDLRQGLGRNSPIEFQSVSAAPPKPSGNSSRTTAAPNSTGSGSNTLARPSNSSSDTACNTTSETTKKEPELKQKVKRHPIDARENGDGKWGTAFDILRDVLYGESGYLDLYEQATLSFIFQRTRMYAKQWEYIPLRHFRNGVWSLEYGRICSPIRISEKKLIESLKHLEEKTFIEVRRAVARANCYRIRETKEIEHSTAGVYIVQHQPKLGRAIVREMEANRSRLNSDQQMLLKALKDELP